MQIELGLREANFLLEVLSDPSTDLCCNCPEYRLLYDCESDCPADKILKEIKNGGNSSN